MSASSAFRPEVSSSRIQKVRYTGTSDAKMSTAENIPTIRPDRDGGGPSTPGKVNLKIDDFLRNRCRPGNPESVRQNLIKVRLAEEEAAKYRSKYEETRLKCDRLTKERENFEILIDKLQAEHRKQVDDLLQQLHKKDRETYLSRYETLVNVLKSAAADGCYEHRITKPIYLNASTETDNSLLPMRTDIQQKLSVQSLPHMSFTVLSNPLDDIDRRAYDECMENISKLEADLFATETELKLAKIKIRRYEQLDAKIINMENQYMALSNSNDALIQENENLKRVLSKLQGNSIEMATFVDQTLEYQSRIDDLTTKLVSKDQMLEKRNRKIDTYEQSYEKLKCEYKTLEDNCTLNTDGEAGSSYSVIVKNYEEEIARLREELSKYKSEADTTKILHFRSNPLDLAHQEYKEFATKKRRFEDSSFLCDDNVLDSTIRRKAVNEMRKRINDLQYQVHKLEKENVQAEKIHSDVAKKYRSTITSLCGMQFKMKEDDIVQVESIFDPGNYFMFKVADSINILHTDCLDKWKQHFHDYVERRNSIPSFLAAVILDLTNKTSLDASAY